MKQNTLVIILVLIIVVLAGFAWYLYSGATKCKVVATDLGTQLQTCAAAVTTYQSVLTALSQVPACAPYLPTQ